MPPHQSVGEHVPVFTVLMRFASIVIVPAAAMPHAPARPLPPGLADVPDTISLPARIVPGPAAPPRMPAQNGAIPPWIVLPRISATAGPGVWPPAVNEMPAAVPPELPAWTSSLWISAVPAVG